MAYFRSNVSGGIPAGVKNLPTVDTASGSIASFNTDLTENLVSVKCQIVAKQASGTPSPSNPLPITTYTEMNLSHSGLNMISIEALNKVNVTVTDGVATGTAQGVYNDFSNGINWIIPKTQIVFSFYAYTEQNASASGNGIRPIIKYTDGTSKQIDVPNSTNTYTRFEIASDVGKIPDKICLSYGSGGTNIWHIKDIQLEVGSVASDYHAYNGTTSNIPFGQTVANGVIDITTGKLRVTSVIKTPLSTQYSRNSAKQYYTSIFSDIAIGSDVSCLSDKFRAWNGSEVLWTDGICFVNAQGRIRINTIEEYASVADMLADYGTITFCCELATPIEIQLDSITLQALLNENNIWCDTGNTEVKFLLTVGKAIS